MIFLCTFLKQKVALGAGGLFIRIFPLTRESPRERRNVEFAISQNKCQKLKEEFFLVRQGDARSVNEQQVTKIIDYN